MPTGGKNSFWLEKSSYCTCLQEWSKQCLKSHRPISLLSVCSKSFERLICSELFTFFTDNNLVFPNQWGFRPGDSCVNQLLAVTYEIYNSFDDRLEVKRVFLDISKDFDKVWHKGLLLNCL